MLTKKYKRYRILAKLELQHVANLSKGGQNVNQSFPTTSELLVHHYFT